MEDFEISPYNINNDFKDKEHINLLKKQIQNGAKLEIVCYSANEKLMVIDGGHSLIAYQQLGLNPRERGLIRCENFGSIADMIAFSRKRNSVRLQQEPTRYTRSIFEELKIRLNAKNDDEAKKTLRRYYHVKNNPEKYKANGDDSNNVVTIDAIFDGENTTPSSFISHNLAYLDFPQWLGELVDTGKLTASQASDLNTDKLQANEELQKRIAEQCIGKSVQETKAYIKAILNFEPEIYNIWPTFKLEPVFGAINDEDEGSIGRTPHQIIFNLLHYYTKENDVVLDPMAGGGTVVDCCKVLNRRCKAFDIQPKREDIIKHDVLEPFGNIDQVDFIFFDPPYYKQNDYEECAFNKTITEFYVATRTALVNCFAVLKPSGYIAVLLKPMGLHETKDKQFQWEDLTLETYDLAKGIGFKIVKRICVPLSTQQYNAVDVDRAKKHGYMLNTLRDLLVMQK